MEITWLGHACFRVRGKELSIVTDPHRDPGWGYPPIAVSANVVTVSHDDPHHAAVDGVEGTPRVFSGPGEYEIGGAMIWGVQTYRRPPSPGQPRQRNTSFLIKLEDVTICHLGDLGTPLSAEQLGLLKDADVLLLPVGGHCTIGATEAVETISQIEPRLIVPMHYATPETTGHVELESLDRFCAEMGVTGLVAQPRLSVTASSLPSEPTVVVLEPRH